MRYIADLHIHSKYSRACSKNLDLEHIAAYANAKGIQIITCADFTHPKWFFDLSEKLTEVNDGLYCLKDQYQEKANEILKQEFDLSPTFYRFMLTTELSCIYSKNGKCRRVHVVVFAPNLEVVKKINIALEKIGNIHSDGRPILGLDVKELAKMILNISDQCFIVPAHAWTPWFSVFGSMSGFDSLQECFEELTPQIYAIETGLSSDPAMNWRVKGLNNITLISNSDSHSLDKLGREANVFSGELTSYNDVIEAIKAGKNGGQRLKLDYTIEFFPEEGKYHVDGHRDCKVIFTPEQSKENNNICPVCHKPLTLGVLNRVEKLADQDIEAIKGQKNPFKSLIPLVEILSQIVGVGVKAKKVSLLYKKIIQQSGSEFGFLLDYEIDKIEKYFGKDLAKAVYNMRNGLVDITPGYDGVYGVINVCKKNLSAKQQKIF